MFMMSRNSMLKFVISELPSIEYSHACTYICVHVYGISKFCTPQTVLSLNEESYPTATNYEGFIRMK